MINTIKTKEEARNQAIAWQNWQAKESLSYSELLEYQNFFKEIGEKYNLTEEFKENGII